MRRFAPALALALAFTLLACEPVAQTGPVEDHPQTVQVVGDSITFNMHNEAYDGHTPVPWKIDDWPGACASDFMQTIATSPMRYLIVAFGHNYHSGVAPDRCSFGDIAQTISSSHAECIVYVLPSFRPTTTASASGELSSVHTAHIAAYRQQVLAAASLDPSRIVTSDWHDWSAGMLHADGVHLARTPDGGDVNITAASSYLAAMREGLDKCPGTERFQG